MSDGKVPPDKSECSGSGIEVDSEKEGSRMTRSNSKGSKLPQMVKKASKRKKKSSSPADSNVDSDEGDIIDMDKQQYTKSELQSLVSKLMKTTAAQNQKINGLGAQIEKNELCNI